MASGRYEVEVKSLLGSEEAAQQLRDKLATFTRVGTHAQLNHYFTGGDPRALAATLATIVSREDAELFTRIAEQGVGISVRTRLADDVARMIMKASLGSDSSENGVARVEADVAIPGYTLPELDAMVLSAGYTYQAKWSRAREEYASGDLAVCLDKNAGYGYLAEFEKVVTTEDEVAAAETEVRALMETLGVTELPQDRLERMFAYYNEHWPDYYGTDKIFIIE